MFKICLYKQDKNVPYYKSYQVNINSNFNLILAFYLLIIFITTSKCERSYLIPQTSLNLNQYYSDHEEQSHAFNNLLIRTRRAPNSIRSNEPTPALDDKKVIVQKRNTQPPKYESTISHQKHDPGHIAPSRVGHYIQGNDNNLFSPIFNVQYNNFDLTKDISGYQNDEQNAIINQANNGQNPQIVGSTFDSVEVGSGMSESEVFEDQNKALDDTSNIKDSDFAAPFSPIQPTPILKPFEPLSTSPANDIYDRPPILNRHLPRLVINAGQIWRYFIPSDTFIDEDGDLTQLKSIVLPANCSTSNNLNIKQEFNSSKQFIGQYNSWLQYDSHYQMLYGFPTENEVGKYELVLSVSDKWGSSTNESFEIHVHHHPSVRAFTHLFVINQVEWDWKKYPTLIDALKEFVRLITGEVFGDQTSKNFIAQYYSVEVKQNAREIKTQDDSKTISTFTIAWSNQSVSVYPCNLQQINDISSFLIDNHTIDQEYSSYQKDDELKFMPSTRISRILGDDFKPTSINIYLLGSCEGKNSSQNNEAQTGDNLDATPKVKIKIGRLRWKLGQPIEYRIPSETFEAERGLLNTKDLLLNLHTIDGLTLGGDPKYNFLGFDQEKQTLYGQPYSLAEHSGQRELQLTARHPRLGLKCREVFVIEIEPQDLSTINNRAFQMSLYFATRTYTFGPRERVSLGYKIGRALKAIESVSSRHDQENPEFIIIEILKLAYVHSSSKYQNEINRVPDNTQDQPDDIRYISNYIKGIPDQAINGFIYKYTWTNSSIGHKGDCPVEVIKENVLYALERSMAEFQFNGNLITDESDKNDTTIFLSWLRSYFEPEQDLIHLRFEPLNNCIDALVLHDVGNSEIADQIDQARDLLTGSVDERMEATTINSVPTNNLNRPLNDLNEDEYWSIIVLIILVAALIFVILVFFMGMHTYKINQDKRFEMQVKLAQARHNSMYLSSMILADQATLQYMTNQNRNQVNV